MNEKLDLQSPNIVNENVTKIAALFPNCVTESAEGLAVDFDLLKQELSDSVVEGTKERYRLEWPGKKEAIVTANLPTTKTLRPVREDSLDFDNTENLYIEGDNLEVLKLLQESYLGKIKMIYIDPPYNTGKDFVYKDNFARGRQEELLESGQKDEYNQRLVVNSETAGRYHSDWLSMMYPRLKLARNLLKEDGVIFISIDDNELPNLRKLCDDPSLFGELNFVGQITVLNNPKGRSQDKYLATCHEYLLIYSKNILEKGRLSVFKNDDEIAKDYPLRDENGSYRELELRNTHREFGKHNRPNLYYPFFVNESGKVSLTKKLDSIEIFPKWDDGYDGCWTWGKEKSQNEINLLVARKVKSNWKIYRKAYAHENGENPLKQLKSIWTDKRFHTEKGQSIFNELFLTKEKIFQAPKSIDLLQTLVQMSQDTKGIILDFYSGSATTAHAVMKQNAEEKDGKRKYIMVQLPEATDEKSEAYKAGYKNICEIGKQRIRRAAKKIKEKTGADIDYGFRVYRLDSSNMQDVYYRPQDYQQANLDLFTDNVKPDRTADDLLAQVMLDWGLPLSLKIQSKDIQGKKVFMVAENSLYACFDKGIDEAFAKEIAKDHPLRIVFRDSGFANDTAKSNVRQLLKQLSPETEMKVI
ncbi:site-specific DNA-methyltransferase [Parapedobacter deserti]|uniref:site-specific DNA-methyltransferase (adenine-specific) n=1 Tax=Parapedobacter deserti TaxID=1912957 RepID=A0ABV7JMS5_9SPHI